MFENLFNKPTYTPETPPSEPSEPNTPPPEGLDKWKNLVDNGDGKPQNPENPVEPFDAVAAIQDPKALQTITQSIDFSKSISSETQQLLNSEDPQGLPNMINDIGKAAFIEALKYSSAITKQHVQDALQAQSATIDSTVNSKIENYELKAHLPILDNPIVRLGTEQFLQQLTKQNPSMTASDKAAQVKDYVAQLTKQLNPNPDPEPKEPSDVDWFAQAGIDIK